MQKVKSPIGIFDSGYGGLTVFKEIEKVLPDYDYIYLGDNARVPYGSRSFETVHEFTWECVQKLFEMGCPLVILACNTASAKALRNIQQLDLPKTAPNNRVLGVIRPSSEIIGDFSKSKKVGLFATKGTVISESYIIEVEKFFPDVKLYQQACPMWVPFIENNEHNTDGIDYYIKKYVDDLMAQNGDIDTILLACTHYPLLIDKLKAYLPKHIKIISQGHIVADSLKDYLNRHPEIESRLTQYQSRTFYTTDDIKGFDHMGEIFLGRKIHSKHIEV